MINKCILMGRLTKDPELRHTASNTAVATFTLAVDRGGKKTEGQQTADFIDIVAWESKAEFAAKWFHKGQLVAVCGRIQSRRWQDNNGNNRTSIEIIADELHFAESKKDSAPQAPTGFSRPISVETPIVIPPEQYSDYGFAEDLSKNEELPF